MKLTFLLLLFLFLISPLRAQKTEILYLSGFDKDHTVQWDFFCTNGMNSGNWSKIAVPSNWELQGFGSYLYGKPNLAANEKGLYKYKFFVSKAWQKKKVFIVFEASMTDTEVKVNGKLAGPVHQGAFYRFKYDITNLLNFDGTNLLEVTVSKESANESINRAERTSDYWVFGGIFRPVYLEAVPVKFIDRVAISAKADGSFYMDVFAEGIKNAKDIRAQVQTLDGKPFGASVTGKSIDSAGRVTLLATYQNPKLWNPEFPNRYQVVVSLFDGKKEIHQITQKFGFRTIEERLNDGFYINGTKVLFRGVCRHTFWPSSGRTSSKQLAIDDVNLMKDMNMNAVRMSHYPPDQYFLDVCDSMGMFVLDELGGWQKFYDTPTAKRLVKELVVRDVNHPSIVLWDNGNEGGFNKEVRGDYALYDPQNRTVIEPWAIVNGTNTKHYPGYKYVENALNNGKEIYFPTEFLHGLFDGGSGAGLDDYWNLITSKPLAAGGFLWVFADEGVERRDIHDSIDTWGNNAPDGILGPYHEKEGSFYTIKEIWSPVYFKETSLAPDFAGKFNISNRYLFSNLEGCKFSYELVKFGNGFPEGEILTVSTGPVKLPDIAPGNSGLLTLSLPADWKSYDALYITAVDQYGRKINKWSWNITPARTFANRTIAPSADKVTAVEHDSLLNLTTGKTVLTFNKKTGQLSGVVANSKPVSFSGLQYAGFKSNFRELKHYASGNNYVIELLSDSACHTKWTILPGGWIQLDYDYRPNGALDFAGITFSYPEDLVTGAKLMSNGPYHVWKNRLKGTQFGVFDKKYNNTITGQTWDYPEFKGYYSNFYAVEIQTKESPITIVSATSDLFLHLFTPEAAKFSKRGVRGVVNPPFPSGNISFLHGISAIGTKFSNPENEGPQGQKNIYIVNPETKPLSATLYFKFGE